MPCILSYSKEPTFADLPNRMEWTESSLLFFFTKCQMTRMDVAAGCADQEKARRQQDKAKNKVVSATRPSNFATLGGWYAFQIFKSDTRMFACRSRAPELYYCSTTDYLFAALQFICFTSCSDARLNLGNQHHHCL